MIARLILALLLAAVAMPGVAPAACHDARVVDHTMPMPADESDHHALPAHACIGCIPPSDWLSARVAAPVHIAAVVARAGSATMLVGSARAPDLRPPRRG